MKKIYSLIAASLLALSYAGAQCVVDTTNTQIVSPPQNEFPCIVRGVATTSAHTIQIAVPSSFSILGQTATVDSFVITDITGLPVGIDHECNPASCAYTGGQKGCIHLDGTTTDPIGTYQLTFVGYAKGTVPFLGQQTVQLSQLPAQARPTYSVEVMEQGGTCTHLVGINDLNAELNAALSVYPNPSTGAFELKLNAGSRINGEIVIVDVTGRKVFTQALDVAGFYKTSVDLSGYSKGIYTVQLRTSEGFASKNISIE